MKTFIIIIILFMTGCLCRSNKSEDVLAKPKFKTVEVPVALASLAARSEYLATHYWDNFDFSDTTLLFGDVAEQAFVDYLSIIELVAEHKASMSIKSLLARAQGDSTTFAYFTELSDRYLYDPNSPMRNEELYIAVLEFIVESDKVESIMKVRPQSLLDLALKNRPGNKAHNFEYVMINGVKGDLYSLKSEHTIIFFNNPGCATCKDILQMVVNSEFINGLIANKRLTLLAVYTESDVKNWRDYAPNLPKSWVNAHDSRQDLINNQIYDLKAIPTLYLLDRDKKVLLKDATFDIIEQMIIARTGNQHQN